VDPVVVGLACKVAQASIKTFHPGLVPSLPELQWWHWSQAARSRASHLQITNPCFHFHTERLRLLPDCGRESTREDRVSGAVLVKVAAVCMCK
jgi:hypothetical protein